MARPKAVETGVTQPEVKQSKGDALHSQIMTMIDAMARNVSVDLTKHQIQASIYSRLENWAKKELKKPVNVFTSAGVENWDSILPKYVSHVSKCSEERHARVENYMAQKKAQRQTTFQDSLVKAIEGTR